MLRFAFRNQSPASGLATSLLGFTILCGSLVGCTVTPDYFPPCVNPYVDTCPVGDASSDAEDQDGGVESTGDASASADASAADGAAADATVPGEAGQATMQ